MQVTSWQQRYREKVASVQEAVRLIPPGQRILVGSGAAEPVALVRAMVEQAPQLADNEVVHLLTLGPAPYVEPAQRERFRHTAFFIGPNVRQAVQEGRADFMPVFLSELPELIRCRRVRIDVALIQVSPPDAHGYVSLGVSVDIVHAAVQAAALVLAEVNPRMPRTHGDSFIHVRELDRLVPVDAPLLERLREPADPVCSEIGRQVATLVPDGATLQVGIGRIPDAVLAQLRGRVDLGVHTEMLSDGVRELVDAGVITGRRKTHLPGKLVTSFVMGTQALYDWVDDHPALEMRASDYTNDPAIIARHERMVAINAALAVDLTGQVAADTLQAGFFSGIGGQVDFIRGAARSRGGKPIVALPSTAKHGTVSRIQPVLEAGAGVVTSRGDVHYVVTEYGVADLWGRNIRERALALVEIAHPDHRAELLAAARARHYVRVDQALPQAREPWAQLRTERLPSGLRVCIRPARLSDERALQELLYGLSDESVYRRFLGHKCTHPHAEVQALVDGDGRSRMALVALLPEDAGEGDGGDPGQLLGSARYDVDPASGLGDVAFVVREGWQGRGLGTALMRCVQEVARARGVAGLQADVLATNKPMLAVFHASGLRVSSRLEAGVYHLEARFAPAGSPGPGGVRGAA